MVASSDLSTAFSGIHGPGLTCLELLQFMGVCVCQTRSQLSLYIYPKLVYSRINQILMSYALSCPCNSMHNFLLCSSTSQLSVGAVTVQCHCCRWKTLCSVKCKSISFCFVFSFITSAVSHSCFPHTHHQQIHLSHQSLVLTPGSTEQDRDLGEGILGQQKSDINQNSYRER